MKIFILLAALFMLAFSSVGRVSAQETKIKWFGHAAFSITTPKGKVLLIDPWLANPLNPEAKDGKGILAAAPKAPPFPASLKTQTPSPQNSTN